MCKQIATAWRLSLDVWSGNYFIMLWEGFPLGNLSFGSTVGPIESGKESTGPWRACPMLGTQCKDAGLAFILPELTDTRPKYFLQQFQC